MGGNVSSVIQLWDTITGQLLTVLQSSSEEDQTINVISSLAAHPILPSVFISGARDGKVSVWDVRCPEKLMWRFLAHNGKLSNLSFSENGLSILSSGRDGAIRLWDARHLPPNESVITDCVREYFGHVTYGHWVPAHYLSFEKYILTGSETNKAFIYETATGRLARIIPLGNSKIIFTAPVPDSVAFYYVNLSTQTIGLCDVEGDDSKPQEETPLQIRHNFMKEKMQEVMLDYADQIIGQLYRLGVLERTGLHQIIETLSQSQNPEAQGLLRLLMSKYEERIRASQNELAVRIMSNTVLPNTIFQRELSAMETSEMALDGERVQSVVVPAPAVVVETGGGREIEQFIKEDLEKCRCEEMDVDTECYICHYCSQDGNSKPA